MNGHILVVDDVPGILKVVCKILESKEYKVTTANSSDEALKIVKKQDIDLLLIDVFMPETSGLELAQKIRKELGLKDIKIIFLTIAKKREIEKDKLEKLKISDFIHKPFNSEDLVERIGKALKTST